MSKVLLICEVRVARHAERCASCGTRARAVERR